MTPRKQVLLACAVLIAMGLAASVLGNHALSFRLDQARDTWKGQANLIDATRNQADRLANLNQPVKEGVVKTAHFADRLEYLKTHWGADFSAHTTLGERLKAVGYFQLLYWRRAAELARIEKGLKELDPKLIADYNEKERLDSKMFDICCVKGMVPSDNEVQIRLSALSHTDSDTKQKIVATLNKARPLAEKAFQQASALRDLKEESLVIPQQIAQQARNLNENGCIWLSTAEIKEKVSQRQWEVISPNLPTGFKLRLISFFGDGEDVRRSVKLKIISDTGAPGQILAERHDIWTIAYQIATTTNPKGWRLQRDTSYLHDRRTDEKVLLSEVQVEEIQLQGPGEKGTLISFKPPEH